MEENVRDDPTRLCELCCRYKGECMSTFDLLSVSEHNTVNRTFTKKVNLCEEHILISIDRSTYALHV